METPSLDDLLAIVWIMSICSLRLDEGCDFMILCI